MTEPKGLKYPKGMSKHEIRAIIDQLEDKRKNPGWRVQLRASHYMAFSPDGKTTVSFPKTPSDYRGVKNVKSKLRRAGAKIN